MKFSDIPQRIRSGSWECNYDLSRLPTVLAQWQAEDGLQLNPDFQRGHVWTEAQQIAFVEYVLTGGQSGLVVYMNKPDWQCRRTTEYNDFVVVDGLQRLTAVSRFVQNEIPAYGYLFNQFKGKLRMMHDMRINVNCLQTKAQVLTWYLQMNAGGTPHTAEEIERVRALLAAEKSSPIPSNS